MTTNQDQRLLVVGYSLLLLILAAAGWQLGANEAWFFDWNHAGAILPAALWANLTLMADTLFAVAALLIAACYRPRLLTQSLLLLIIGGLFVHAIKQGLNLPRPPLALDADSFRLIGPALKNESFPSGHAFTAMSAAALMALNQARTWASLLLLLVGSLAALSRVMVGAHWPLDILVGGGCGILIAWLCMALEQRLPALQAHGWKLAGLVLLTLATVALAFHDDRYPDTQLLTVATSLIALWFAVKHIWLPLIRLMQRAND